MSLAAALPLDRPAEIRCPDLSGLGVLMVHVRKNVLPAPVVEALARSRLTVVTEPGHAQAYPAQVDVRLVDSVRDPERVRRVVLDVRPPLDHVVAPFELGQATAGYLRSCLGLPGIGFDVANACSNKHVMKQRMAAAGLPMAPHRLAFGFDDVARAAAELGRWPVVVKPAVGGGAIHVLVVRDRRHLEQLRTGTAAASVRALDVPLVVEAWVDLEAEYHCDGIVDDGEVRFAAAQRYLEPLLTARSHANGSWFLPPDDPALPTILDLHARAVAALGLRSGVTHMEFLGTPGGILASEIACRPAGGAIPLALRAQYGVDVWGAFLATATGQAPAVAPVERPGILVNAHLPLATGTIARLTDAAVLAAQPAVVHVEMLRRAGDHVPGPLNSSSASGYALLRVSDPAEIPEALDALAGAFVLEVA